MQKLADSANLLGMQALRIHGVKVEGIEEIHGPNLKAVTLNDGFETSTAHDHDIEKTTPHHHHHLQYHDQHDFIDHALNPFSEEHLHEIEFGNAGTVGTSISDNKPTFASILSSDNLKSSADYVIDFRSDGIYSKYLESLKMHLREK